MPCSRRSILHLGLCGALASGPAQAMDFGATDWPEPGDRLVRAGHPGAPLRETDILAGARPILAWPFDAAKRAPRTALFSQILLLRFDAPAASPVLAYSAVCKHAGCIVSDWVAASHLLLCPCHGSEYDPAHQGAVVTGPAADPLPTIPLTLVQGELVIAGTFSSRPGGVTARTD
ncbi:QcrA and Rieske domain-containing protein [Acidisoma sp. 7E03]